jgi:hypothetical protein
MISKKIERHACEEPDVYTECDECGINQGKNHYFPNGINWVDPSLYLCDDCFQNKNES